MLEEPGLEGTLLSISWGCKNLLCQLSRIRLADFIVTFLLCSEQTDDTRTLSCLTAVTFLLHLQSLGAAVFEPHLRSRPTASQYRLSVHLTTTTTTLLRLIEQFRTKKNC